MCLHFQEWKEREYLFGMNTMPGTTLTPSPPLSSCDSDNKFVRWPQLSPSWLHSTVNVPKATELYTCKSLISRSVNFASISKNKRT